MPTAYATTLVAPLKERAEQLIRKCRYGRGIASAEKAVDPSVVVCEMMSVQFVPSFEPCSVTVHDPAAAPVPFTCKL